MGASVDAFLAHSRGDRPRPVRDGLELTTEVGELTHCVRASGFSLQSSGLRLRPRWGQRLTRCEV
jgi:hypothetical protein